MKLTINWPHTQERRSAIRTLHYGAWPECSKEVCWWCPTLRVFHWDEHTCKNSGLVRRSPRSEISVRWQAIKVTILSLCNFFFYFHLRNIFSPNKKHAPGHSPAEYSHRARVFTQITPVLLEPVETLPPFALRSFSFMVCTRKAIKRKQKRLRLASSIKSQFRCAFSLGFSEINCFKIVTWTFCKSRVVL